MYMIYWIISKFNILTHHIQPFNLKNCLEYEIFLINILFVLIILYIFVAFKALNKRIISNN